MKRSLIKVISKFIHIPELATLEEVEVTPAAAFLEACTSVLAAFTAASACL